MFRKNKANFFSFIILLCSCLFSQSETDSLRFELLNFPIANPDIPFLAKKLEISFNNNLILNNGHSNLDNNAEFFSPGRFSEFYSFSAYLSNRWLAIRLEPFIINHHDVFITDLTGNYAHNNNHNPYFKSQNVSKLGLRQSFLAIKYKNIGIRYGKLSHWWGPGIHSSLSLSSNAPSQKSYSIGTFDEIKIKNYSIKSEILIMPYKNAFMQDIYFSGLRSYLSHTSKNSIITFGFHRTYLSGDILKNNTNKSVKWSIFDAAKLVIEPLFGQSKSNQDYTVVGTQGFDFWDQVLSAFIKFNFLEEGLILFIDVASDDNRANFTDLRAHWDHTLAYQIGMNKNIKFKKNNAFIISEFTSTKGTNTFNGNFYRGNELSENFYTKTRYDYFSYEGRRMGAHSGTSSEDLYFLFGVDMKTYSFFISYNSEIHGIKNMEYPELKSEIAFGYQKYFSNRISINIFFEYEEINNFEFIQGSKSISRPLWVGLRYSFKK